MSGSGDRGAQDAGRGRPARRRDTLVTAVYDLDPAAPLGGRKRSLAYYLPSLASIAALDAGLVVYTRPAHVERVVAHLRALDAPAVVVGRELDSSPRFRQIQEIRTRQAFHSKPWRDRCHVLCHAKPAWLAEQAESNPFSSDRFYWIDAGLAYPGLFPPRYLPDYFVDRCTLFIPRVLDGLREADDLMTGTSPAGLLPRSLVMIGRRPPAGARMHNIRLEDHLRFIGEGRGPIDTHVVGALFGGTGEAVRQLYTDYHGVLGAMLDADLLGTEENVLTILYHRDPASVALLTFSTWYHEDSRVQRPDPGEVPFYRIFEALAGQPA